MLDRQKEGLGPVADDKSNGESRPTPRKRGRWDITGTPDVSGGATPSLSATPSSAVTPAAPPVKKKTWEAEVPIAW